MDRLKNITNYEETLDLFVKFCESCGYFKEDKPVLMYDIGDGNVLTLYLKLGASLEVIKQLRKEGYIILSTMGANKLVQCDIRMKYDIQVIMVKEEYIQAQKDEEIRKELQGKIYRETSRFLNKNKESA